MSAQWPEPSGASAGDSDLANAVAFSFSLVRGGSCTSVLVQVDLCAALGLQVRNQLYRQ